MSFIVSLVLEGLSEVGINVGGERPIREGVGFLVVDGKRVDSLFVQFLRDEVKEGVLSERRGCTCLRYSLHSFQS